MTPLQAKNTKIAVGVAVASILLYVLLNTGDPGGSEDDPTGNNGSAGDVATFNANKIRLELFDAMNQAGTDEDAIIHSLRNVTAAQFNLVVTAFGQERYSDIFGYKTATGTPRSLPYWLKAELSADQYLNLKRKYPNSL